MSEVSDRLPHVLRPSWRSSLSVGPLVAVAVVSLAVVLERSVAGAVLFAVVFGMVFAILDRTRTVELTEVGVEVRDARGRRSLERSEVLSVSRGRWWTGGLRLSASGKDLWLGIGDQPFGRVSDERLDVVANWATTR